MSLPAAAPPSLADQAAEAFRNHLAGSTGAIDELVSLLTPPLWSLARSAGLSTSQAEDVVQTAWLRLLQRSTTIEAPQAVFAWLLTTVKRESWRVAAIQPSTTDLIDERPDQSATPEQAVTAADQNSRLWAHVKALNPRCQALLRVIAFAARPDYAAISTALGMPVGSIGPTRGRCLARLRASLAQDPTWTLS